MNGVSIYSAMSGASYLNGNVWHYITALYEVYDLDICGGTTDSSNNYYHRKYPRCLAVNLGDAGFDHSPIYGWMQVYYKIALLSYMCT